MTVMKLLAAFLAVLATAAADQPATIEPATLVLRNGKIVTVEDKMPEAQAVAIRGDRILALATTDAGPSST